MPDERTMIVTGASSGIGRALAIGAAREGYRVVLVARRAEQLEDVAHVIRFAGGTCTSIVADVCASGAAQRTVSTAMDAYARIDVVVNNAGSGAYGALLEQTDAAIEAQWQLHVVAPLRLSRAALPHLERSGGQLVFIGSGLARVPLPKYGAYAPAKAAIRAAAIQLRRELRDRGIAVTYVDPGLIETEFHQSAGIERASHVRASTPERAAAAILRGITRRAATVNAIPWQTAGTIFGELVGTLADPTTSRLSPRPAVPRDLDTASRHPEPARHTDVPVPTQHTEVRQSRPEGRHNSSASLETALEPLARRMERVKLPPSFVRDALVPGATLELGELAMRWAGMPNKNERAALREVLDALTENGYLEPTGDETWKVLRAET
jgi:short-subunit dehydrogenase